MRLTSRMLRRIIAEEIQKIESQKTLSEGTTERPIHVTPEYINSIIKEELAMHQTRQSLAEARRRRRR